VKREPGRGYASGDEEPEWAEGVPAEETVKERVGRQLAGGGGGGGGREGHVRSPSSEYPPGYNTTGHLHQRRLSAPTGTAPVVI